MLDVQSCIINAYQMPVDNPSKCINIVFYCFVTPANKQSIDCYKKKCLSLNNLKIISKYNQIAIVNTLMCSEKYIAFVNYYYEFIQSIIEDYHKQYSKDVSFYINNVKTLIVKPNKIDMHFLNAISFGKPTTDVVKMRISIDLIAHTKGEIACDTTN